MPVPIFDAAKYILKNSPWNITQLELQKLLYIAQMVHLGEEGRPLMRARFEAWMYGPVNVSLRDMIKQYGNDALPHSAIDGNLSTIKEGSTEENVLNAVIKKLSGKSGLRLITITHWENGAWKKTYRPNLNIDIPEPLMQKEYFDRKKKIESENSEKDLT